MSPLGRVFWFDQVAIGSHRWVVFSNQTPDDQVLTAPITTFRDKRHEDRSCILRTIDYGELDHDSWVNFQSTKLFDLSFVDGFTSCPPLPEDAIQQVIQGAAVSDRIEMGFREILVNQRLIAP